MSESSPQLPGDVETKNQSTKVDNVKPPEQFKPEELHPAPELFDGEQLCEWSNDTVPPKDRKVKLIRRVQTNTELAHKVWLGGWALCVVAGTISTLWWLLRFKNKWYINSLIYRLAWVGAIAALTVTMIRKFGLATMPSLTMMATQVNFNYLVLANVWLLTFRSVFKIVPYILLGVLHLAEEFNVVPILKQSSQIAQVIAFDELFLIVYLFLRTILVQQTSGFQLAIYLVFYWMRVLFNNDTKVLFSTLIKKVDWKTRNIKNKHFQKYWKSFKKFVYAKQTSESFLYKEELQENDDMPSDDDGDDDVGTATGSGTAANGTAVDNKLPSPSVSDTTSGITTTNTNGNALSAQQTERSQVSMKTAQTSHTKGSRRSAAKAFFKHSHSVSRSNSAKSNKSNKSSSLGPDDVSIKRK
ncbi:hypothetical protein DIURU_004545 [Diutina rugosa]|uniref:Uncharacterized protein n=1 Tax=Diutina rugosa TaxID=5481 RepID=A0A642UGS4_DIURU|nr:uncharacterized protein DIURU_004545 [Diutina rugosa]KAA8898701.1 hypothetical protein DIURU_004545 [Diutina rugosa]